MKNKFLLVFLGLALVCNISVSAQKKHFTIEDLWKDFTFRTKGISEIRSMNDGGHFTVLSSNNIIRYEYESGKIIDTIVKGKTLYDEKGDELRIMSYEFSSDESKVLLGTSLQRIYRYSTSGFFFIYETATGNLTPLSHPDNGRQRLAEFSPDGNKVAFVRNNNIFITDLNTLVEIPVTTDGEKNKIINGTCDWVYEEEFSFTKGFHWSPSGKYIAYYKFDESEVKEFTLTYHGQLYPREVTYKYPKAGEDNSVVTIHTYNIDTRKTQKMDTGEETDQYLPRIMWTTTDKELAIFRMNRLQNHLEVLLADPRTGVYKVLYEERNKYYIDITDNIYFLSDLFILTSEMHGFNHIYSVSLKSGEVKQITMGDFDVVDIIGIDKKRSTIYYRAAAYSPIDIEVWSIRVNGKKKEQLTKEKGHNNANFSQTFDYYILNWSDANTPNSYSILNRQGETLVELENNEELIELLKGYEVPNIEFHAFTTSEGIDLNYWIMRPVDFDPEQSYPLVMYVYGGPGSQTVRNSWSYQNLWFFHLTQLGYIVISVDNRGTGLRGEEFKKLTYLQLGKYETIDQIEAAKHFGAKPYIDQKRIGIFGWSYGGYMSTLCMTKGADQFKAGIAVAPVTNWRYYDNIYTERFMRTPQENGENYDINSPITHVDKLEGAYLLVHGLTDDNVHVQNAYDLVTALVEADKQFDMFIYPNRNHGIFGGNTRNHLYRMMTDFILNNL